MHSKVLLPGTYHARLQRRAVYTFRGALNASVVTPRSHMHPQEAVTQVYLGCGGDMTRAAIDALMDASIVWVSECHSPTNGDVPLRQWASMGGYECRTLCGTLKERVRVRDAEKEKWAKKQLMLGGLSIAPDGINHTSYPPVRPLLLNS